MGVLTARQALNVAATRDELKRLDDEAWELYGDLCHYVGATDKDRENAFAAALASLLMLLDHDRQARQ